MKNKSLCKEQLSLVLILVQGLVQRNCSDRIGFLCSRNVCFIVLLKVWRVEAALHWGNFVFIWTQLDMTTWKDRWWQYGCSKLDWIQCDAVCLIWGLSCCSPGGAQHCDGLGFGMLCTKKVWLQYTSQANNREVLSLNHPLEQIRGLSERDTGLDNIKSPYRGSNGQMA